MMRTALTVICLILLLGSLANATQVDEGRIVNVLGGGPQDTSLTATEQQFLDLLNAARRAEGLHELTLAPLLVDVAREKSKEMYELDYWGHVSPVEEKRTAMRRVLYYLPEFPSYLRVGENLAFSYRSRPNSEHRALMDSPTHRKNILHPSYRQVGIGNYTAPDGRSWTTQVFLQIEYDR